jgi:hypothetical protein
MGANLSRTPNGHGVGDVLIIALVCGPRCHATAAGGGWSGAKPVRCAGAHCGPEMGQLAGSWGYPVPPEPPQLTLQASSSKSIRPIAQSRTVTFQVKKKNLDMA